MKIILLCCLILCLIEGNHCLNVSDVASNTYIASFTANGEQDDVNVKCGENVTLVCKTALQGNGEMKIFGGRTDFHNPFDVDASYEINPNGVRLRVINITLNNVTSEDSVKYVCTLVVVSTLTLHHRDATQLYLTVDECGNSGVVFGTVTACCLALLHLLILLVI